MTHTNVQRTSGEWSPQYGIVLARLADSVVKDNVMWHGALKTLLEDLGQHGPNTIVRDNVGRLYEPTAEPAP